MTVTSAIHEALSTLPDPVSGGDIVASGRIKNVIEKNGKAFVSIAAWTEDRAAMETTRLSVEHAVSALPGVTEASAVLTSERPVMAGDNGAPTVKDKYNMDGHKLFWHLDRVAQWERGERVAPLHLDMGITNGCNMACTFCYGVIQGRAGFGTDKKGRTNMPTEVVKRTFSDAKKVGVRSIALIGEGENTLHPDFHDIIQHGRDIGLDLSLATNGIRIDHNRLDVLLTSLKWLRVNISAGEKEAFEKIHQVPQYERVLKNIEAMSTAKKTHGYECTVGLQMVVTRENMNQVVPLARLGRELGADYFVVKACSDTPDQDLDSPQGEYMQQRGIFEEAESYATEEYTVSVKWEKLANGGYKDYDVCFGTEFILGISGNGNVFPCGHWFDVRSDEFLMGNLVDTPFAEIVASDRYWEVQKKIKSVNVNRECETNCRQHYINRFLWSVANEPTHVNFI